MNKDAWISGITAFIIAAGGALGVVFVGDAAPTGWQIAAAIMLGLVSGAKDVRSLMKLPPLVTIFLLGLCSFGLVAPVITGCGTSGSLVQVKEGSDPIVVRAEWLAENGANSLDQFLAFERNNQAALSAKYPGVHGLADLIRDDIVEVSAGKFSPASIVKLRTLTKQYKTSRTESDAGNVASATEALLGLVNEVRAYMSLPPLTLPTVNLSVVDAMKNAPTNGPNQ